MSTEIPYVYQYQRTLMFQTGTEVQKPQAAPTSSSSSIQTSAIPSQALGFPSSLTTPQLAAQPLLTPLLGLSLNNQTSPLTAAQGLSNLQGLKAPLTSNLEAPNPVQAKLAALQPPPLPPEQVVTGPFANADKALAEKLAVNRGVEIVKAGTQALEKSQFIPPSPPARVEDRTLQMPPMPQTVTSSASQSSGMLGMMARLHEMFSPQVRNPTEGQGGQSGPMNMGGSASGEGHKGEHSQKRQQTSSRFSAMA